MVSKSIQTKVTASLNCTVHTGSCEGENCFYWFQNPGERHQGLIYTKKERRKQRKKEGKTQTCYDNLSTQNLTLHHAGNRYCAVLSCGHILFKNRIELDFESKSLPDNHYKRNTYYPDFVKCVEDTVDAV